MILTSTLLTTGNRQNMMFRRLRLCRVPRGLRRTSTIVLDTFIIATILHDENDRIRKENTKKNTITVATEHRSHNLALEIHYYPF